MITPANPTGYVLCATDLDALADIANRHNLIVVSDESYDRFVYDDRRHLSPGAHIAAEFQKRRDDLLDAFHSLDVPVVRPQGGPFLFPDVSGLGRSDGAADWLLREWGVPAVDGALLRGAGHVRLAFGADDATFEKFTRRLRMAFGARAPVEA